jgi:hypothetical protein
MTLAALFSIRDHLVEDTYKLNEVESYMPNTPQSRVESLICAKMEAFKRYMGEKAGKQTEPGAGHEHKADCALEEMLKYDVDIYKALFKTADEEEMGLVKKILYDITLLFPP